MEEGAFVLSSSFTCFIVLLGEVSVNNRNKSSGSFPDLYDVRTHVHTHIHTQTGRHTDSDIQTSD